MKYEASALSILCVWENTGSQEHEPDWSPFENTNNVATRNFAEILFAYAKRISSTTSAKFDHVELSVLNSKYSFSFNGKKLNCNPSVVDVKDFLHIFSLNNWV